MANEDYLCFKCRVGLLYDCMTYIIWLWWCPCVLALHTSVFPQVQLVPTPIYIRVRQCIYDFLFYACLIESVPLLDFLFFIDFVSAFPQLRHLEISKSYQNIILFIKGILKCLVLHNLKTLSHTWKLNIFRLVKFMFSKKTTKIDEIFTVDLTSFSKCQIEGEDFLGLLRTRTWI